MNQIIFLGELEEYKDSNLGRASYKVFLIRSISDKRASTIFRIRK